MKRRSVVLVLGLLGYATPVAAKDYGFHSPGGRRIYHDDERFDEAANTRLRRFVVEAAAGAGPEATSPR